MSYLDDRPDGMTGTHEALAVLVPDGYAQTLYAALVETYDSCDVSMRSGTWGWRLEVSYPVRVRVMHPEEDDRREPREAFCRIVAEAAREMGVKSLRTERREFFVEMVESTKAS